jgi:hypothetical protein
MIVYGIRLLDLGELVRLFLLIYVSIFGSEQKINSEWFNVKPLLFIAE